MIAENDHGRIFSNVLVKWSFIFKFTPKWSRQNGRLSNIMPLTKMTKPGIWNTKMIKDLVLINVFASPSPFNIVQLTLWLGKEELSFWRRAPCPWPTSPTKTLVWVHSNGFYCNWVCSSPWIPPHNSSNESRGGRGSWSRRLRPKNTHKNTLLLPYCFSIRNTSRMEWSKRQGLTGGTLGVRRVGGRDHRRSGNGSPRTSASPAHWLQPSRLTRRFGRKRRGSPPKPLPLGCRSSFPRPHGNSETNHKH